MYACHIFAGTSLALPHLQGDGAHRCHICGGTALTAAIACSARADRAACAHRCIRIAPARPITIQAGDEFVVRTAYNMQSYNAASLGRSRPKPAMSSFGMVRVIRCQRGPKQAGGCFRAVARASGVLRVRACCA